MNNFHYLADLRPDINQNFPNFFFQMALFKQIKKAMVPSNKTT